MAHARKDTLVGCGERRKHLKTEKTTQARLERQAAKRFILVSVNDMGELVDKHGNRWIPAE